MTGATRALALCWLVGGCAPPEPLQVPRAQHDLDGRSIVEAQGPASHNTYLHTPAGEDLTWHFSETPARPATRHIEIDIRDRVDLPPAGARPSIPGDWWIAHHAEDPVTVHCGNGSLGGCLDLIAGWHRAHPGHPFTTIWIDKKDEWSRADHRGPADLDRVIDARFDPPEVFRPAEMVSGSDSLRQRAQHGAWPTRGHLAGRLMFILTAKPTENRRLHRYVADRAGEAWAFVAPHEAASSSTDTSIEETPEGFDRRTAPWVGIYNFAWCSSDGDDRCDSAWCILLDDAAAANFLTRVWDLDDAGEHARAVSAGANFLPVNCPWLGGEDRFCRRNDSCPDDP